jgi:hypothetical protein
MVLTALQSDSRIRTVAAKTSAYTMTADDSFITCDTSGGAFTVTLPDALNVKGREFDIKKIDSSANAATLDGKGSQTIDGSITAVIQAQYESVTVISDGSTWHVI